MKAVNVNDVLKILYKYGTFIFVTDGKKYSDMENEIANLPSVTPKQRWIPIKTRPMTDEEATYYRDWAEYEAEIFDCPLPEDGQEVLVSWGNNVSVDIFIRDNEGCYFENYDISEVDAWMPLPEPMRMEKQ